MSRNHGTIKRLLLRDEVYVCLSDVREMLGVSVDRWMIDGRPWAAGLVARFNESLGALAEDEDGEEEDPPDHGF